MHVEEIPSFVRITVKINLMILDENQEKGRGRREYFTNVALYLV